MTDFRIADIVAAIRSVLGPGEHELQKPWIIEEDAENVARCVRTNAVGYGYVARFEQLVAERTGAKHVVGVASGTAALHLALMAVGVKPGDEVITSALTFAATANAICHAGATPHFVDVSSDDLGVSPFRLQQHLAKIGIRSGTIKGLLNRRTGKRIAAIVPVHLLGMPCRIQEICDIARGHEMKVVEDAAEALGSMVGGIACGTIGDAGVLSFNNNKVVSTGGGGAVLTADPAIAERVLTLATTAKVPHPYLWDHTEVAWNYRLPNVCAALGVGQLRRLPKILQAKRTLAQKYQWVLAKDFAFLKDRPGTKSNYWLNAIDLPGPWRDELLTALIADGMKARALFRPLHQLEQFSRSPRADSLYMADSIYRTAVCLPSSVVPT